eukprot:8228978-Pyramimonas_sp.AAC.1
MKRLERTFHITQSCAAAAAALPSFPSGATTSLVHLCAAAHTLGSVGSPPIQRGRQRCHRSRSIYDLEYLGPSTTTLPAQRYNVPKKHFTSRDLASSPALPRAGFSAPPIGPCDQCSTQTL